MSKKAEVLYQAMTREGYERLNEKLRAVPHSSDFLTVLSGGSSTVVAVLYILTLFFLFLSRDFRILMIICPPLAGFIFISMIRSGMNLKRPYEKYDIVPLIEKETKGNSFPSRHVFSAFSIGVSLLVISPYLSLTCLIAGMIIAVCRVLSGVHYIMDVVFGAAFGSAISLVFDIIYFVNH